MSGQPPPVAVLMPVHNDQAGLDRSLASLAEDGGHFVVVVVDDGSTPPLRLPNGLPFATNLVRLEANRGIVGALNAGLAHIATLGCEYVARLDAGDRSRPGRIAAQTAFLDANPEHAAVGCAATFVDPAGQALFVFRPPSDDAGLRRLQRYRFGFLHPALMFRRAALAAAGGYDARFPGAEDYELVLRLAKRWKLANLPEVYLDYEVSPSALSSRRFRQGLVRLRVQARHFAPRDPHAWLGIARNLLLLLVSRGLVLAVKRRIGRWGGREQPPEPSVTS